MLVRRLSPSCTRVLHPSLRAFILTAAAIYAGAACLHLSGAVSAGALYTSFFNSTLSQRAWRYRDVVTTTYEQVSAHCAVVAGDGRRRASHPLLYRDVISAYIVACRFGGSSGMPRGVATARRRAVTMAAGMGGVSAVALAAVAATVADIAR